MKELLIVCCIIAVIISIQAFRYWMYYKICSSHSLSICKELYKEMMKMKAYNAQKAKAEAIDKSQ